MVLIGDILDPQELLHALREIAVDAIIITPLKVNEESQICNQLLNEFPIMKIITLSAKGEAAYLYQTKRKRIRIDEPSEQSILSVLRDSI